jgi:hypothetical protein
MRRSSSEFSCKKVSRYISLVLCMIRQMNLNTRHDNVLDNQQIFTCHACCATSCDRQGDKAFGNIVEYEQIAKMPVIIRRILAALLRLTVKFDLFSSFVPVD